jgi:L-arabinokinase
LAGLRILLALTSHGLGHLTRSLEVARALRDGFPSVELIVASSVPEARIAVDLPRPFEVHAVAYEPGTLQRSAFELDEPGTCQAYLRYASERETRLRDEEAFLRAARCDAVISDIPALPIRAAARLGLPALGVGNFTWDWILEPLLAGTDAEGIPALLADDYAHGRTQLVLPLGTDASPFPASEPAPLVSRRARLAPQQVRARLALPDDERTLVLVCPGGWDADDWGAIHVPGGAGLRWLTVGDLPVTSDAPLLGLPHALPDGVRFPDLVAAADVVLAKPGYGIASECLVHRTPMVAIERPGFRETPLLWQQFRRDAPGATLSLEAFFAGDWETAVRAALDCDTPFAAQPQDGAARLAERLGELLGIEAACGEGSTA